MNKIHCPHIIRTSCSTTVTAIIAATYTSLLASTLRHFKTLATPKAIDSFVIHTPAVATLSDEEILTLARGQRRTGDKFSTLWAGDFNAYFNSRSEADSSVMFTLAFYTKDPHQLDRLYRTSGLMRAKWDEIHGEQTYGDMTIAKALSKVTRQYKPRQRVRKFHDQSTTPNNGRPEIIINSKQLDDITNQCMDAIKRSNDPPVVFVRTGSLARVVRDEKGRASIESMEKTRVRCRLSQVAYFYKITRGPDGPVKTDAIPPLSIADNILAQSDWDLPQLEGIVGAPILRRDGTICSEPGYDPESHLMYCPDPSLKLTHIPEFPDSNEIQACVDILLNVIGDFPFVDEASRANALSILFTILMRPVIDGNVPLAIVDAPVQGTGKSLLVKVLAGIAIGSVPVEALPTKHEEEEWRKKITSILLTSSSFVLLDNIPDNSTIKSATLASLLTTDEWADRLLGRNDTIKLPAKAVWVATGNNLRVAGDIPRRSYTIRLDANAERPWEGRSFDIDNLERHIANNRGDLLSAALTIIRGWYTNGCPLADVSDLGSFEDWSRTIGSVLKFAGIDGFLANADEVRIIQDEDTQEWSAFFDTWWKEFEEKPVTVDQVVKQLILGLDGVHGARTEIDVHDTDCVHELPYILSLYMDKGEGALKRSLGKNLSRLSERIFNGHKVLCAGTDTHRRVKQWKLLRVINPPK